MKIVVTGWVVPFPSAGLLWHYAQYVLAFQALGFDVWYLEDSGDHPWGWDQEAGELDESCRAGVAFLARELDQLGLGDRWCFRHVPSGEHHGLRAQQLQDVLADADVLVDVSCSVPPRPEYRRIPHRLAIDTDPVFTQVKVASGHPHWAAVPVWHTRLFTFGRPPLPAQAHDWVPTRQPVALDCWPRAGAPPADAPFTTVAAWRSYPPVRWDGEEYGAKDRSLADVLELPRLTGAPLAVALGPGLGRDEGVATLTAAGWGVLDGWESSRTTAAYRSFIEGSAGEFGVAKHGYVAARSGWFSERTCLYLAAGRPAIVQDTGWSRWLPTGSGLLPFRTATEAATAIDQVNAAPVTHARAARALAEEHFDGGTVCASLLEAAL